MKRLNVAIASFTQDKIKLTILPSPAMVHIHNDREQSQHKSHQVTVDNSDLRGKGSNRLHLLAGMLD